MTEFTNEELKRYSRHILLEGIGTEGQIKIKNAKVLVVGAGGLGSPVILYLAAAGVGTIGIIDGDNVNLSNLQRQVIHFTNDVATPKTESAKQKVNALNPNVNVITYKDFLTKKNAEQIISQYDFVVEASDNYAAKYRVNDTCVKLKKPFNLGGINKFEGQTFTYIPGSTCFRCIFPEPPANDESCEISGVFGAIAGMLGTIQAAETLKFITGIGELLTNKLLTFEAKTMDFNKISTIKNPDCKICGENQQL
jgi:molybdopterin/thiamine biosynthesis adenylyltransferase